MNIKKLKPQHWEAVKHIFEAGIQTRNATLETTAPSWGNWNKNHLKHIRLIFEIDKRVAGWCALTAVSDRCVYVGVAEVSIYIHPGFKGLGIGYVLLARLITESEANGIWTLNAAILEDNKSSIRLHEKSGFRKIGVREKIGQLNGVWRNIVLFEKRSKEVGV